ncbi:MAG: dihydrodipicolinate synthase family protein [Acidimicrobiia bacterium]
MPANLLPFDEDLAFDEASYRAHLRWLIDTPGVTGIVANGHAAEVSSLSREERRRGAFGHRSCPGDLWPDGPRRRLVRGEGFG